MFDIQRHYESYRQAVSDDALDGFPDASKIETTKNGATFEEELRATVRDLQGVTDLSRYQKLLTYHQSLVIELFTRMVGKLPQGYALNEGLNWHQFTNMVFQFETFYWVPNDRYRQQDGVKMPVFTTYEMKQILAVEPPYEGMLKAKKQNPNITIINIDRKGNMTTRPAGRINREIVLDWTQELFNE